MVEEARNIISEYNQKIGDFKKRVENLATRLNSQNLSESEIESINNMAGQLCTDIDGQRSAMLKQRIAIVEKACVVVEKKIAEIQQKIVEKQNTAGYDAPNVKSYIDNANKAIIDANEEIKEVKQYIDKAKTDNDEKQLLSAENFLQSAEYDRQIAKARQRTAEANRKSAEARRQSAEAIKNIMHIDSIWIINHMEDFYDIFKRSPGIVQQSELDFMRKSASEIVSSCKKYGIDYKAILRKEVGDEKKVKDILKFYEIE